VDIVVYVDQWRTYASKKATNLNIYNQLPYFRTTL